jgi:hypothetical protein
MSGYLTSLLQRTFGPEALLQPELTPLFAPPAAGPGWLPPTREDEQGSEVEDLPSVSRNAPRATALSFAPPNEQFALTHFTTDLPTQQRVAQDSDRESRLEEESPSQKPAPTPKEKAIDSVRDPIPGVDRAQPDLERHAMDALTGRKTSAAPPDSARHEEQPPRQQEGSSTTRPRQRREGAADSVRPGDLTSALSSKASDLLDQVVALPGTRKAKRLDTGDFENESSEPPAPWEKSDLRDDVARINAQLSLPSGDPRGFLPSRPAHQVPAAETTFVFQGTKQLEDRRTQTQHALKSQSSDRTPPVLAQREQAPSIQVTIGKIEVVATNPGQPVKKQPTPPNGPTLEEYLRRRSEGSRG